MVVCISFLIMCVMDLYNQSVWVRQNKAKIIRHKNQLSCSSIA